MCYGVTAGGAGSGGLLAVGFSPRYAIGAPSNFPGQQRRLAAHVRSLVPVGAQSMLIGGGIATTTWTSSRTSTTWTSSLPLACRR